MHSLVFIFLCVFFERRFIENLHLPDYLIDQAIISYLKDHAVFQIPYWYAGVPLLIAGICLIVFKRRTRGWALFGGAGLLIGLLVINRINYYFFSTLIPLSSFVYVGQAYGVKESIIDILSWSDVMIFVPFVFLSLTYAGIHKQGNDSLSTGTSNFIFDKALGILFCLVGIYALNLAFYLPSRDVILDPLEKKMYIGTASGAVVTHKSSPLYVSSDVNFAKVFGLFSFYTMELQEILATDVAKPEPEALAVAKKVFKDIERLNQIDSPFYGAARNRNLIMIALESFHPSVIALTVGGVEITPTLNRLIDASLYWSWAVDQIKYGGSADAEFAICTGLFPSRDISTPLLVNRLKPIQALPAVFNQMGYHTISFHGNTASFWRRGVNHPVYGFQHLYFKDQFSATDTFGMGVSDKAFFSEVADALLSKKENYFAYLITLSNHHPFIDIPADYESVYQKIRTGLSEDASELATYLTLVRYTDDALGIFMNKMETGGGLDNAMVVLFGDHRPPLSDASWLSLESVSQLPLKGLGEHRVPVMITIPGMEESVHTYRKQYCKSIVSVNDLYPTICHLMGETPSNKILGVHFFVPSALRGPIFFNKSYNLVYFNEGVPYYGGNGHRVTETSYQYLLDETSRRALFDVDPKVETNTKKAVETLQIMEWIFNNNIHHDIE